MSKRVLHRTRVIARKNSRRRLKQAVQQALRFSTRGGVRKGAGRKPKGERAGVKHRVRPGLKARFPVHVTLRVEQRVWSLRSRRCFGALRRAFLGGCERAAFRICEFAVLGNHIHMIVEASGAHSLSRGMQGIAIRMAKALNRQMHTSGRVFADRYHAHILTTRAEVRNALGYVVGNFASHQRRGGKPIAATFVDPYSSQMLHTPPLTAPPRTWLLTAELGALLRAQMHDQDRQRSRRDARDATRLAK
jgi:putative transposase